MSNSVLSLLLRSSSMDLIKRDGLMLLSVSSPRSQQSFRSSIHDILFLHVSFPLIVITLGKMYDTRNLCNGVN